MKSKAQEPVLNVLSKEVKAGSRLVKQERDTKRDRVMLYDAKLKRRQYAAWVSRPGKRANRFKRRYRDRESPFMFLLG